MYKNIEYLLIPQMAPIGTFILFSMMNYYSMIPKSHKSQISQKSTKALNWKW